jgi:hypothetical protein
MAFERHMYFEQPIPKKRSSSTLKILAIVIIIMVITTGGLVFLIGPTNFVTTEQVKVAVLDSGIDSDFSLIGKVVSEKSFISPIYDYNQTDSSVTDADPEDVPHGTLVAKAIVAQSRNAQIVNGKVLSSQGTATTKGLIAGIEWAVEQNCSVINLSLGSTPTYGDPLGRIVKWAFDRGVVIVAACGNEGDSGLAGTSISSPGVFPHCLAVAALDEDGEPESFSSTGPTAERYMKPDIATLGSVETSNVIYFGTSFAAPRVSGAAAELIAYCISNDILYTPGSIMTALLKGANPLPYPSYVVGAGELDLQGAIDIISENSQEGELPEISYINPRSLPIDYERFFLGDTYKFNIQILTSSYTTFAFQVSSETADAFILPSESIINQTGFVPLTIEIPVEGVSSVTGIITCTSPDYGSASLTVDFTVSEAIARVAFDISHTPWSIDTYYGQFRELYKELIANEISVSEIRQGDEVTVNHLEQFDAVFILDPCAWDYNETDINNPTIYSLKYSIGDFLVYPRYYENGGSIFVVGLSNESIDIESVNEFLNWTGFSFDFEEYSDNGDTIEINQIAAHPITVGVESFDYFGCAINQTPEGATILAQYGTKRCLACSENGNGGRFVITGSNFWVDNWGMTDNYKADDNDVLALRVALWLCHII